MFAIISEQVVSTGIAVGRVLRVVKRPRALRLAESPCAHGLAAPEVLHGRNVFTAPGRVVQYAVIAENDALVHDRPLAPEDDIAGEIVCHRS